MSKSSNKSVVYFTSAILLAVAIFSASGCSPAPEFRLNGVETRKQEIQHLNDEKFSREQLANLGEVMTALFGTPDQPAFPYELFSDSEKARQLVNPDRLKIAAGAVSSDRSGKQQGLYREHCVHCHGVSGDGLGPTAATLNPYPRDFRMGKFKFKHSKLGRAPSREDIRRTLVNGIPGTSMPSFRLLQQEDSEGDAAGEDVEPDELEALIDYVIYLSFRGQVERSLLAVLSDIPEDQLLIDPRLQEADDGDDSKKRNLQVDIFSRAFAREARYWEIDRTIGTDEESIPSPPESLNPEHSEYQNMVARGRELFLGKANCFSCHGNTGLGDGQLDKYDFWTEDWLSVAGNSEERKKEFRSLGALKPRKLKPRNLRHGVFRGGNRPIDIYYRIKNGIEGTAMPAVPGKMPEEDVWALVEYVRQLASE